MARGHNGDENAPEREYAAKAGGVKKAGVGLVLKSPLVNVVRTPHVFGCAWHNGLSPPPRGGEHVKESHRFLQVSLARGEGDFMTLQYRRCAGLDVHRDTIAACIRIGR